jgi:predicted  nucleic acid-binding Zn ribbon protein
MTHTIVAHFPSHVEAEMVVLELQKEGFDMQKLSIIGKDYQRQLQTTLKLSYQVLYTAQTGISLPLLQIKSPRVR